VRQFWRGIDPLFLFVLFLAAGTLSLIVAVRPPRIAALPPRPAVPRPAPLPPPRLVAVVNNPDVPGAERELRDVTADLAAAEARMQALAAQLEEVQSRIRELEEDLRRYQAMSAGTPGGLSVEVLNARRRELENLLAAQKSELVRLTGAMKDLRAAGSKDLKVKRTEAEAATKLPELVDLIHNRAFPMAKGFYRMPLLAGLDRTYEATRTGDGLTIAEIRAPEGAFSEFLSRLKPERQYVSCLLNNDSFEAYYAVREVVTRRGLDIGWEPADTSGGRVKVYTIKLVSAEKAAKSRDEKVPELPDIVRDSK